MSTLARMWREAYTKVKASTIAALAVGALLAVPQWVSDHATALLSFAPPWAAGLITLLGSPALVFLAGYIKGEANAPTTTGEISTSPATWTSGASGSPTPAAATPPTSPEPTLDQIAAAAARDASTAVPNPPPTPPAPSSPPAGS